MITKKLFMTLVVILFLFPFFILDMQSETKTAEKAADLESLDEFIDLLMDTESISRPNYEHYDISPDGRWIAFAIERSLSANDVYNDEGMRKLPGGIPITFVRQDIWIGDTQSGELKRITNGKIGKNSYWHPVWSPNGRDLAFYGDKDGRVILWICHNASGKNPKIQALEETTLKAALFRWDRPRWLKDGKKLIVPVLPEIEKTYNPGVDDNPLFLVPSLYQKFLDPKSGANAIVVRSSDESSINRHYTLENRVDLAIVDTDSGKFRRLTNGQNVQRWELSPDERMIAFKVYKKTIPGSYDSLFDLHVMSLEDSSSKLILEDTEEGYNFYCSGILWSPDSCFLLERKKEDLVVLNIQNGEKKIITPGNDLSFSKNFSHVMKAQMSPGIASYIWSPKADQVIAQNEKGWWLLSLDDTPPKKLFEEIEVKVMRIMRTSRSGNALSLNGNSMILEIQDPKSGKKGLFKADLNTGRFEMIDRVPSYSSIYEITQEGDILYAVNEDDVNNLWFSDIEFSKPLKLTDLNDYLRQIPRGKKLLIEYLNRDGKKLKGAVLLPPDYEEGKNYPLVTVVYGGSIVSNIENSFSMSFSPIGSIPQLLSRRGYVVLQPSIPLSPVKQKGSPLEKIPESVLSAVNKVVEKGIADTDRIGVIGHSYGGYSVNVLITQTSRFKAAVSMAGISDLVSHYLVFIPRSRYTTGGSLGHMSWAEEGQGRMGVPLWDDRLQYIENSPIFFLDKVETPLLLIHGDLDGVTIQEAEEMFSGLKRLDKTVEFVRYFGETHVFNKPANIRDSWHRIVDWFDKHLRAD